MSNIGYLRCSTDDERQNVDRQLMGIDLDKKYVEYQSGKSEKGRPIFQEMLSSLRTGDVLYFQELSRAGRNSLELQITLRDLVQRGIIVHFISEGLVFGDDDADPMKVAVSKIILANISSFNELFLTQTSIAVKQGQSRAKKEGKLIGGSNPVWHETYQKNKVLGLHKKPAFIQSSRDKALPAVSELKKIINYSEDSFTMEQLASKLNSTGLTTARGGQFNKTAVSRLLKTHNIDYTKKHKHL